MNAETSRASEIRCEALGLVFPNRNAAVQDIDLRIPAGEIVSLVGPSGCGKTTLLRLIAGLEQPTTGRVTLEPPVSAKRGEIAFVFQQPALLPWRTTLENVCLPLELIGGDTRARRREFAEQLLSDVGLSDAGNQRPHELSGGMRMRVSIARALATSPRVLLLDEPFAALDDLLRAQLGQLVVTLWRKRRFTTVLVTHNIAEAILLSNSVVVMQQGRLREQLTNPLPKDRDESIQRTPEFGAFYGRVSDSLRALP